MSISCRPYDSSTFHTGIQYTPVASIATALTRHLHSHCARARNSPVIVPNRHLCRVSAPSFVSLITHTAMLFLCTSIPQQLRWTLMALLLHHRRRRLLCTILPCELPSWRAVSLHCSYGVQLQPVGRALNYCTIGKIPGSIASDAPILSNSHTFSCFIVTGSVMLGLLATSDIYSVRFRGQDRGERWAICGADSQWTNRTLT